MLPCTPGWILPGSLWAPHYGYFNGCWLPKMGPFQHSLELGKRKSYIVLNPVNMVVTPAWQSYFCQKFPDAQSIVNKSIVVAEQPWICLPQFSSLFSIERMKRCKISLYTLCLIACPCGMNSVWTISRISTKAISIILTLDLDILAFLGRGEEVLFHSKLLCLVSGLYWKITYDLWPETTPLSRSVQFQAFPKCWFVDPCSSFPNQTKHHKNRNFLQQSQNELNWSTATEKSVKKWMVVAKCWTLIRKTSKDCAS